MYYTRPSDGERMVTGWVGWVESVKKAEKA